MRIKVAFLRDLEKQVSLGEISYSRMVEILNEQVDSSCIRFGRFLLKEAKEHTDEDGFLSWSHDGEEINTADLYSKTKTFGLYES